MDPRKVQFRNDVQELLKNHIDNLIVSKQVFPDCTVRPITEDGVRKIRIKNLCFNYRNDNGELREVDGDLVNSRILFDFDYIDSKLDRDRWSEFLQSFNAVLDIDDLDERDYLRWEQKTIGGRKTGGLKVNDDETIEDDLRAEAAIEYSVNYLLAELLPQHEPRLDDQPAPPEIIQDMLNRTSLMRQL